MKNYKKLRAKMLLEDVKLLEIADLIGCAPSSASFKFNGKAAFTLWESYRICQKLKIPLTELVDYFPV